jgi:hypothetical protein
METLAVMLTIFPIVYLSAVAHEAGHAVLSRLVGLPVSSFGMGLARPFLVLPMGGTRFYLCLSRPFQGFTFVLFPNLFPSVGSRLAFFFGGILVNALLGSIALVLFALLSWEILAYIGGLNWFMALANLMPFTIKSRHSTFRSDGAQAWQLLRHGSSENEAPEGIQNSQALQPLFEAIGDHAAHQAFLIMAASQYLQINDLDAAEKYCAKAGDLAPRPKVPFLTPYRISIEAQIALRRADSERGRQLLDEAQADFLSQSNQGGLTFVALIRAEWFVQKGDRQAAWQLIESLGADPLVARHPSLQAAVQIARLYVGRETAKVREEYEAQRRRCPSATWDLEFFWTLARCCRGKEDWPSAARAYDEAVAAALQLNRLWTRAEEQAHFQHCQADLLSEAHESRCYLGPDVETAPLPVAFPSFEELKQQRQAEQLRRNCRYSRLGWILILLNFLGGLGLFAAAIALPARHGFPVFLTASLLAGSILTAPVGLLLLLAGRLVPRYRNKGGGWILFLGVLPWLLWLLCILLPPQN